MDENATEPQVAPQADAEGPKAGSAMPPASFASALFGRTALEDLERFEPHGLACLARAAWDHLGAPRPPGRHIIRLFNGHDVDASLPDATILEVINEDMPFLLDSTLAQLNEMGLDVRLVAHPILPITRNAAGHVSAIDFDNGAAHGPRESLIHIHLARLLDFERAARLMEALEKVYSDIRVAVEDWRAMRARVRQAIADYRAAPPPLPADEIAEAIQFLEWMESDNFTLLGVREYGLEGKGGESTIEFAAQGSSGLGILRDPDVKVLRRGQELVTMTPELMEFLREPHALIITKANVRSRVHRAVHMDYIGVKQFEADGTLAGELRIVGLFTAGAYTRSAASIPYIRHKVAKVIDAAALDAASHSGKILANVLETYPRDELFQIDTATLSAFATEIATLYERPRLRVLARADKFDRFVSVLVFIPRDRYDTRVRMAVGDYLSRVYAGRISAVYPHYPEGPLVRTHYIVGRYEGATPVVERAQLEAEIGAIVRTWHDDFLETLAASGQSDTLADAESWSEAFSEAYRSRYSAARALEDMGHIAALAEAKPVRLVVERARDDEGYVALRVFSRGKPMPLSDRVPMLENAGFRVVAERTSEIAHGTRVWLHDMDLEPSASATFDADAAALIEDMLTAVNAGLADNDGFNGLTLAASLAWRDAALIRTLSRYLRQAGISFSQAYMAQVLVRNAPIARQLSSLFHIRFDPDGESETRAAREAEAISALEAALAAVTSLDEDRILRRFLNLIRAALRTNFWQRNADGSLRELIAIKFDSRKVDDLRLPRPMVEIFLHAPRVEGIHLRFGKVARGGLRWSDRPQDFRTEVLGLVKAQQVKNAVIVPVGAKGGFVPKLLPPASDREAWMAEGTAAYKIFVSGLLDLTDNLDGETIVPPPQTLRFDGDDPYLVVAADKGTATFSDTANAISLEHRHWLGDAFASGGSAGYDHKKMGITARGAWECVKRHFREMDIDIQSQPFRVAGVGDMSGDVFGNGMLLSPQIQLVAAFDHRDIFLDPHPDAAKSLAERRRLFDLPRSSWKDFNASLISQGGGIFPRSAKEIALSPEVREMLGLEAERATPQEVMRAILRAPVDLLWFGGIGTYIRASSESDESVGDRANDPLRIAASDIQAKVIGEGANLGMTQRGRIEAALKGIRLNSDAIDNSAGVNTSDVEVNIKIATATPIRDGRLDVAGRNALLASMTEEVAALVLRNNYMQSLALSLAERRSANEAGFSVRLMQRLEGQGRLDRAVEYLPSDAAISERLRTGRGLTRPELAVLLAYAKLALHDDLLASDVVDDPYLGKELMRYFPPELRNAFPDAITSHKLGREIVATQLANAIINRCGPTIAARMADESGADAPALARGYAAARDIYDLLDLNLAIDALDGKVSGALQLQLYAQVQELALSRLSWIVRNVQFTGGIEAVVSRFRVGVQTLADIAGDILPEATRNQMVARGTELVASGVPAPLAAKLAMLPELEAACDIVLVAERAQKPYRDVATAYFAADGLFGLSILATAARRIPVADYYDRLSLDRTIDQIDQARRRISTAIMKSEGGTGAEQTQAWFASRGADAQRILGSVRDIVSGGLTLAKASVAAGMLGDLVRD